MSTILPIADKRFPFTHTCMFYFHSEMDSFPPKCCRHPIPLIYEVLINPIFYGFGQFLQILLSLFSLSMYFVVLPLFLVMEDKLMGALPRNLPQKHILCYTRTVFETLQYSCHLCASFFVKSFYLKQKSSMFSKILFLMFCSGVVELPCLIFIGS